MRYRDNSQVQPLAVSIDEAQRLTGLSRSTIKRLIGTGRIESAKIGRRRLLLRRSVEELLNA